MTLRPTPAAELDAADPFAALRDGFHIPQTATGDSVTYLCGNSLGLMHESSADSVTRVLHEWGSMAVDGHFAPSVSWSTAQDRPATLAAALVGARPAEVVLMNSLTVNLHLLLAAFYRPDRDRRRKIVLEADAFPSDRYAVASQIALHGAPPDPNIITMGHHGGPLDPEGLDEVLTHDEGEVALVVLPGVNYHTGQLLDIAELTAVAHRHDVEIGFDLAHAIGNVPLDLHRWDVDFAAWCSYKYLNGGPGAIAGAFINERHDASTRNRRLAGWWGHESDTRFEMDTNHRFAPSKGAAGWQVSNPSMLALAPVTASLDLFTAAGIDALRLKSIELTGRLESSLRAMGDPRLELLTPSDPAWRGCQLSLYFGTRATTEAILAGLAARGVIADFRASAVIRLAPVPLYNTFADVDRAADALADVLAEVRP